MHCLSSKLQGKIVSHRGLHPSYQYASGWIFIFFIDESTPVTEEKTERKKRISVCKIYTYPDCLEKRCLIFALLLVLLISIVKPLFQRLSGNSMCISTWKSIFQIKLYMYIWIYDNTKCTIYLHRCLPKPLFFLCA